MPCRRDRSSIFDLQCSKGSRASRSRRASSAMRPGALTQRAYLYMIFTGDEVSGWPLQPLKEVFPLYDEAKV
jgi:hypothetical protein